MKYIAVLNDWDIAQLMNMKQVRTFSHSDGTKVLEIKHLPILLKPVPELKDEVIHTPNHGEIYSNGWNDCLRKIEVIE